MAETLKEIKYKGSSVLVEAAKRDSNGDIINNTYAKITNTYTKTEIQTMLAALGTGSSTINLSVQSVTELPTTVTANTICLYNNNSYVALNNTWNPLIKLKTINGTSLFGDGNITISGGTTTTGISTYAELTDKPSINTISLSGNKTSSDLGLQDKITTLNQLDADLIKPGTTNKLVTATEKATWNAKAEVSAIKTKTSELINDSNFVTLDTVTALTNNIQTSVSATRSYTNNVTGSLADKLTTGDYDFTNATDSPVTETTGFLKVDVLNVNKINQQWETANSIAKRTITYSQTNAIFTDSIAVTGKTYSGTFSEANNGGTWESEQDYTINNSNGVIQIPAGGNYTISGNYNGRIKIVGENPVTDTVITLNGVKLKNTSGVSLISYESDSKKLIIVLKNNTYNYLLNEQETVATTKISDSVIYSNSDLMISGTGGLNIRSNTGLHGIKADKIIIGGGKPIIDIKAVHDGIHGTKSINIQYGKITIDGCNDGIEAKNSDNTDGLVMITGGELTIKNCTENAVSSTLPGVICNGAVVTSTNNGSGLSSTISVLTDATINGLTITKKTFQEYYGTGKIKYVIEDPDNEDHYKDASTTENLAALQNQTYTIGGKTTVSETMWYIGAGDAQIEGFIAQVSGYIDKPIIAPDIHKFKIVLNNAYITSNLNLPSIHAYCVEDDSDPDYTVIGLENTVNYISNTCPSGTNDHDALKSEGDMRLSGDGTIITKSTLGDGYDAKKLEFKGDGARYAYGCGERGFKGTTLYFGGEKDGSSKSCASNIYALGNNTLIDQWCADIYAINSSTKHSKGSYIVYNGYNGLVYANTFNSININTDIPTNVYTKTASIFTTTTTTLTGITQIIDINTETLSSYLNKTQSIGTWSIFVNKAYVDSRSDYKKVKFSFASPISGVSVYKYATSTTIIDDDPTSATSGTTEFYARNGDFGFPEIDTTGQINFSVEGLPANKKLTITPTTGTYNKVKTPYTTTAHIYRITKVSADSVITLGVEDETSETVITYNYPTGYSDYNFGVTVYRTEDCLTTNYAGIVLTPENNIATDTCYNSDDGYKMTADGSKKSEINFKIAFNGGNTKKLKLKVNENKFNKFKINDTETAITANTFVEVHNSDIIKFTKVNGNFTITFELEDIGI